ncbi:MAG: glycosyltransferase [Actinomycetota bacterium]|nr:glycosyltransferase [Actinomycetota bacterium]
MDLVPSISEEIEKAVSDIGTADVMVAIPAYNAEETIAKVMKVASEGLSTFFADRRTILFVVEGGSLDETKSVARVTDIGIVVDKIVGTYRGEQGKGNALRAVFKAALDLNVNALALIDSDERNITPDWINNLLLPILSEDYDFVTPYYNRYKYDGTITNMIVYPFISALYGKRIRQPIGGEFGVSSRFISIIAKEDAWDRFVGQFGIDAWLTITALTRELKICQANLGAKVHRAKDPAFSLGPMYMQVLSTVFRSMSKFEDFWMEVRVFDDVEVKGLAVPQEPEPIPISVTRLIWEFELGMSYFSSLYREILSPGNFKELEKIAGLEVCEPEKFCEFHIPPELWARIVYDFAVIFNCWKGNTHKLVDLSSPIYFGQVASFANQTMELDRMEAEKVIDEIVRVFENEKGYLIKRWRDLNAGGLCAS